LYERHVDAVAEGLETVQSGECFVCEVAMSAGGHQNGPCLPLQGAQLPAGVEVGFCCLPLNVRAARRKSDRPGVEGMLVGDE
jgi:hypothetical protein